MGYWDTVRQRMNSLVGNFDDFELVINGVALAPQQIVAFRQLTGLPVLEPGRFWFDAATGAMGKEGSRWPLYQPYAQRSAPLAGAGRVAFRTAHAVQRSGPDRCLEDRRRLLDPLNGPRTARATAPRMRSPPAASARRAPA